MRHQSVLSLLPGLMLLLAGCGESPREVVPAEQGAAVPGQVQPSTAQSEAVEGPTNAKLPVEYVSPPLTEEEISAGWISLFDGRSLFGWEIPLETNWHVEGDSIVADSGSKSLLLTPFELDDFELRCSFYLSQGGNSGIFLRTADTVTDPARDTYELNICDTHATHKTGSLVGRHVAMDVPTVEGAWHDFRVLCQGPHIQVWLDGKQIVDFTDTSESIRLIGRLGLQKNEGRAAYKNVCVRPLRFNPLLNGQDTTAWHPVPGSKSEFVVRDGLLNVSGGPGFLETDATFQDFAMKVTARIHGEGVNSGVFFRAMPGTEKAPSNGYEMQLQNGKKDGDPAKPADYGTGAIFRRTPARRIVANDPSFFTAVLIAQRDYFASWVNGYQVVSWTDTREDRENPREGRRLAGGHLSLQGHDPGTNLDFQAIDIHSFVK
jgi:hypothetical protein